MQQSNDVRTHEFLIPPSYFEQFLADRRSVHIPTFKGVRVKDVLRFVEVEGTLLTGRQIFARVSRRGRPQPHNDLALVEYWFVVLATEGCVTNGK